MEIPSHTHSFAKALQSRLRRDVDELRRLYERDFPLLVEKHYTDVALPPVERLAAVANGDTSFIAVYNELRYRHMASIRPLSVEERFEAFTAYIAYFDMILKFKDGQAEVPIPHSWLWDSLEEFVSQYQDFHILRHNYKDLSADDVKKLKGHENVFAQITAVRYLQELVKKSRLGEERAVPSSFYRALGIYAAIALMRVYVLSADYENAVKALDPLDLHDRTQRPLFQRLMTCHTTLYYNLSFAYLMSSRYLDAVKTLSGVLMHLGRHKHSLSRHPSSVQLTRRIDQMYGILALSLGLCFGQDTDENLAAEIRERFGDKLARLQKGEAAVFEEIFMLCAPTFVTAQPPKYAATKGAKDVDNVTVLLKAECKKLLSEVAERVPLADLHATLKLCTSVSIPTLAALMGMDKDTLTSRLLSLKAKLRTLRWKGGPPSRGEWVTSGGLDFNIDKEVVTVQHSAPVRQYSDFLIRSTLKLGDLALAIRAEARHMYDDRD